MVIFESDGKAIFKVFIGAIIALAIIAIIGTSIAGQTQTATNSQNVTAPAINGTLNLLGRSIISTTVIGEAANVTNTSSGLILQTATSSTTGLRTAQLTINDTAGPAFAGQLINVTYVYQPDGYLDNGGARAMALLIPIFAALAILIFAIVVFIKDGSLGRLMGRS